MKNTKVILWSAIALLAAAAIFITYSLVMILGAKAREKNQLDQWDRFMSEAIMATPTPLPTFTPAPTDINQTPGPSANPTLKPSPKPSKKPPNNQLGLLTFPTIGNKRVVVVNGITKADLRGAAGHAGYSVMPGEEGNCIIFGHRDGVFSGFGKLKKGDIIRIQTTESKYSYMIISMTVVKPYDPLITKKYSEPILTLVTCYPFNYVGAAPNRYVVVAELVI